MATNKSVDVNRPSTLWSLCLLASITPSVVLLGPLIVGGLITELGFSAKAAGNMIFAELSGAALSTLPAFYWISRVDWRKVLTISIVTIVCCNGISAFMDDPWTLGGIRFVAGLGVGTVMAITLLTSGMTKNQERILSFWMMGQIIFAATALAIMPYILPLVGLKGFYLGLGGCMAVLLFPVRYMPSGGDASHRVNWSQLPAVTRKYAPAGLVGLLFFFIAMGGVWNFLERIGHGAGFDRQFIALTLSGVSAIGVLGAISAAWLSLGWGRKAPFLIGIFILAMSMMLLLGLTSQAVFIAAAFLFKYGWWFISPYILANISSLDPSGKLVIATNFVIALGQALGPLIIGFTLPETGGTVTGAVDFTSAIQVGLVCLALCCVLFIPVIKVNDSKLAVEP